jgi:hypothetical protein
MIYLVIEESIRFSDKEDVLNAIKKFGLTLDDAARELFDISKSIGDISELGEWVCREIIKKSGLHCYDIIVNADEVIATIYTIGVESQEDLIEILMHNKEHINEEFSTKIFEKLL